MNSIKKQLFYGGAWAFAGKIVMAAAGVAINALLTRMMTPKEVGAYFLTSSIVAAIAIAAQLGLNQSVICLVAESLGTGQHLRARQTVVKVFCYGGLSTLIVVMVFWIGFWAWLANTAFHSALMANLAGLSSAWIAIATFQSLTAETFRGFHDIRFAAIFGGMLTSVLSVSLLSMLWLIRGYAGLNEVVVITVTGGFISVLTASVMLWGRVRHLYGKGEISGKEILNIALPLLITSLTLFVLTQADFWILAIFQSQEDVAIYGAVTRLVSFVAMPLVIVNSVVSPMIASLYAQRKKNELEQILRTTATLAGLPSFIILLFFVMLGKPVLGLVFGDFYKAGNIALTILAIGQVVNVWTGSCGVTLIMTGFQKTIMMITIFSGTLTVILILILINHFGIVGAASGATIGMICQNILMWLTVRKKTNIWTHMGSVSWKSLKTAITKSA